MRLKALVIILIAGMFGFGGFIYYQNQYQKVTITIPSGLSASIYKSAENHDDAYAYDSKALIRTIHSSENFKLKKNQYVLVVDHSNNYTDILVPFDALDKPANVNVPNPEYTKARLASLLPSEISSAKNAIISQIPNVLNLYSIEPGKLYLTGDWYGTKLDYKRSSSAPNSDTLRVILHKENGAWKVVTNPPSIVISSVDYPSIPKEVLSDVNNFL